MAKYKTIIAKEFVEQDQTDVTLSASEEQNNIMGDLMKLPGEIPPISVEQDNEKPNVKAGFIASESVQEEVKEDNKVENNNENLANTLEDKNEIQQPTKSTFKRRFINNSNNAVIAKQPAKNTFRRRFINEKDRNNMNSFHNMLNCEKALEQSLNPQMGKQH